MEIFKTKLSRDKYIDVQIERSRKKYNFCKVSINHIINYFEIIKNQKKDIKNILCLGSRHGREVDLFRAVFFNRLLVPYIKIFEIKKRGYNSLFSFVEKLKMNDKKDMSTGVFGVELNPQNNRKDHLNCSFDEMPKEFSSKFEIIYSNSFDQSQDPIKTANEWNRCLTKDGYLIIAFRPDSEPSVADPVGRLNVQDILKLFPGELIYFNKRQSNYSEVIIKKNNKN